MAKLLQQTTGGEPERVPEERSFTDRPTDSDFDDLIHSWGRLGDPGLRRLAIRLIRMLGEDPPGDHVNRSRLA